MKDEIWLDKLNMKKYHTGYYILDNVPASAERFYDMPGPNEPSVTASLDPFLHGQEILTGGQRIHCTGV